MKILPCNNSHNTSNAHFFTSVNDIDNVIWQQLNCNNNLYFNAKYLEALQKNNSEEIQFYYLVLYNNKQEAIAFATIQVINFYLDSVQDQIESVAEWIKCMGQKLRILSPEKPLKILTCGNCFVSGEHGIYIKPTENKQEVLNELATTIIACSKTHLNFPIDAFMLKDFKDETLSFTQQLKDEGYNPFNVEPNMVLTLDKNWLTFDDYLADMKTKFRVKAKKAMKQSSVLKVDDITENNIESLLPKMTKLYKKVTNNAKFNLGDFNLKTYIDLKKNLSEKYILKAYWLNDNLVGFLSGIINNNTLDAHFVGIDYSNNREYAVYQRILYDYILLGIQQKVNFINFGRTASEIKSSVGATPQNLTIYLRHKNTIPNKILRLFLNKIKPTEFKQKLPFKVKKQVEKV